MLLKGYEVERERVPEYFTEEAQTALTWYARYRRYGWPWPGGWADQPAVFFDVVECLDIEAAKRKKHG